jgi:hypothetical protein
MGTNCCMSTILMLCSWLRALLDVSLLTCALSTVPLGNALCARHGVCRLDASIMRVRVDQDTPTELMGTIGGPAPGRGVFAAQRVAALLASGA